MADGIEAATGLNFWNVEVVAMLGGVACNDGEDDFVFVGVTNDAEGVDEDFVVGDWGGGIEANFSSFGVTELIELTWFDSEVVALETDTFSEVSIGSGTWDIGTSAEFPKLEVSF